jgi:hypothetical protein
MTWGAVVRETAPQNLEIGFLRYNIGLTDFSDLIEPTNQYLLVHTPERDSDPRPISLACKASLCHATFFPSLKNSVSFTEAGGMAGSEGGGGAVAVGEAAVWAAAA